MSWRRSYIFVLVALFLLIVLGVLSALYKDLIFKNQIFLLDSRDLAWHSNNSTDSSNLISGGIAGITSSDVFTDETKWCSVDLNQKVIESNGLKVGDNLKINLCGNINYTAKIDQISKNINDTTTIHGSIIDNPLSYIIITSTGDKSFVDIEIPEEKQHFVIQGENLGKDYLIDRSNIVLDGLEDAPTLTPPEEKESVLGVAMASGDTTVDVMVVYTAAARAWADSYSTGINNVIAQAMASGQLVNDNSNTGLNFRLVYSFETDYAESGSSSTDLTRLTRGSDGYMDNVQILRDQYGADLVVLLAKVEDVGGISWLLNSKSGRSEYAYSLSRVQQAQWTYTVVHEMGHNMGAHHSKLQNFQPGPGLYSYSAGWRWVDADGGKYCSVMTYEAGAYFDDGQTHYRVAHWSNPDINYKSVATGNASDGDNARNIRNIKSVISQYRNAVEYPTISMSSPSSSYTLSGPVTYTITYGGAINITLATGNITLNRTGTANGSVSVSGGGNVSRTVTISNITGIGTLGISISAGTATNSYNNLAPAVGPSVTFAVGSSGGGTVESRNTLLPTYFSNGWNMSSFPDLSGGINGISLLASTYKIRRYEGTTNSYIKGENSTIILTPGAGYWIKIDDINKISGRSYTLHQTVSTEIPVTYGWNLLGNPYQSDLPLANLRVKYKDGTTQSYQEAVNDRNVVGYVWSWEASSKQYIFISIYPERYRTDATKETFIKPYRGFWLLTRNRDVSSIILNR